jgi:hypothetical protein
MVARARKEKLEKIYLGRTGGKVYGEVRKFFLVMVWGISILTRGRKKWLWNKFIPGIIFFGGLAALIIHGLWNRHLLKTYPHYTIGTTIQTYWTFASGKQLEYGYTVNNKYYKNSDSYDDKSKVPGGKCFVKLYVNDPNISEILQDKPVPDSIKIAPPQGWKEIPYGVATSMQ